MFYHCKASKKKNRENFLNYRSCFTQVPICGILSLTLYNSKEHSNVKLDIESLLFYSYVIQCSEHTLIKQKKRYYDMHFANCLFKTIPKDCIWTPREILDHKLGQFIVLWVFICFLVMLNQRTKMASAFLSPGKFQFIQEFLTQNQGMNLTCQKHIHVVGVFKKKYFSY